MTIPTFPPHLQDALNTLYGDRGDSQPASDADPQQRLNRAAVAAAEQLQQQHEGALDGERLSKALALVLGNAVQLRLDGSASVRSGAKTYTVANGTCSCPDHQNRAVLCKHLLAVGLHKRAAALLRGTAKQPAAAPAPPAPASAAWDVHEAPTSCYLKWRVGHIELSYTMRDVDDHTLASRLQQVLPRVQAVIDAEEARQAERAASRTEEQQPASHERPPEDNAPTQRSKPRGQGQRPNGSKRRAPKAQEGDQKWCGIHATWMPWRSNANGSWYSHVVDSEDRWCKGEQDDEDMPPF